MGVMSVSRPARCLFSVPTMPSFRPRIRCRNFHASPNLSERQRPKRLLKGSDVGRRTADDVFKQYSQEEKALLAKKYTPEQIQAIEAGEKAISAEDLDKRGIIRTELGALPYLDDLSQTRPVLDRKAKWKGPVDPNARPMTYEEMEKNWNEVEEQYKRERDLEWARNPPKKEEDPHAALMKEVGAKDEELPPPPPSKETPPPSSETKPPAPDNDAPDAPPHGGEEHHDPPTFYIGFSLILGFILMFLIDKLPRHAQEHIQPPPATRHISLDNLSQSIHSSPHSPTDSDSESESFLQSLAPTPKQTRSLATTTGLVIHAAADGIAMGASATSSNTKLGFIIFVAIMIHKAPAAFGLTSVLLKQGLSKRAARGHLIIFSLAAPVGALGTWVLVSLLGGDHMEGERGQWWTGMLLLFSAGTFLYVLCT